MPKISDFPAHGKILSINDGVVVFHPHGTNYRLHLQAPHRQFTAPIESPLDALIRLMALKVWTVPSGGLFIAPIFGPPRTIQGRVKYLDERELVLHAGTHIVVDLPATDSAFNLGEGEIEVGKLVNVTALPGAAIQLLEPADHC